MVIAPGPATSGGVSEYQILSTHSAVPMERDWPGHFQDMIRFKRGFKIKMTSGCYPEARVTPGWDLFDPSSQLSKPSGRKRKISVTGYAIHPR